ncbi:MAG: hypothetical protein COA73_06550 [Candidatus Hydrogenedentota bacterium]|nr:MAG: hypothetical protein COA73_06550 [Candidatus Hydrogenedentota bacterium]
MPDYSDSIPISFVITALAVMVLTAVFALLIHSQANRWLSTYIIFLIAITPYALFVLNPELPFTMAPILIISAVLAIAGGIGRAGQWFSQYPLWLIIGIQGFRLPLEFILHGLYVDGLMPKQMTWLGSNFDVIAGADAIIVAVACAIAGRSQIKFQITLAITFSIVGLVLLANVIRIAASSLPHGLTEFSQTAPLLLPYTLPYSYIIPVFVFTALFAHIALLRATRKLIMSPSLKVG